MRFVIMLAMCVLAACQLTETASEQCARLAAHPGENAKVADEAVGTTIEQMKTNEAIAACTSAVAEDTSPENQFRLARALISNKPSNKNVAQATELAKQSVKQGYEKAHLVLGYINYQFVPQNAQVAFEHYKRADAVGMMGARGGMALALAFGENTAPWREQGVGLLEELAAKDPIWLLTLADALQNWRKDRQTAQRAEAALKLASVKKIKGASHALANLYFDPKSLLRNMTSARKYAEAMIREGDKRGYGILIDSHYRKPGKPDYAKTLKVALRGAKSGDPYSNYIAGHMYAHGQGTKKDSRAAEPFLNKASASGFKAASDLLRTKVRPMVKRLKNLPSYSAQSCVKGQPSSYDRSIINYRNSCSHGINTVTCDRHLATELWSLLDRKDRETCRSKWVAANAYISNFYGANERSSLLRKAISNTSVKVGACHPPLLPYFVKSKVLCREP